MTILPLPQGMDRMETGPMQFGDDWPGVFIRGDNALGLSHYLEHAIGWAKEGQSPDWISVMYMESLIKVLRSCDVNAALSKANGDSPC